MGNVREVDIGRLQRLMKVMINPSDSCGEDIVPLQLAYVSWFDRLAESREGQPSLIAGARSGGSGGSSRAGAVVDHSMDNDWGAKLYDPSAKDKIHYDLVDVKQIMCFMPLIPDYEHVFATIPHEAVLPNGGFVAGLKEKQKEEARVRRRARVFPLETEDKATQPGSGSKTYYINTLALLFGSRNCMLRH